MAYIQFQFQEFSNSFWGEGKGRTFGKMIDQGLDSGKIQRSNKEFHVLYLYSIPVDGEVGRIVFRQDVTWVMVEYKGI